MNDHLPAEVEQQAAAGERQRAGAARQAQQGKAGAQPSKQQVAAGEAPVLFERNVRYRGRRRKLSRQEIWQQHQQAWHGGGGSGSESGQQ